MAVSVESRSLHARLLIVVFAATYLAAQIGGPNSPWRWAIYGIPAVSIVLWIIFNHRGALAYNRDFLTAFIAYSVIATFSVLMNPRVDFFVIRDVLIISGALLTFVPKFIVEDRDIKMLTIALAAPTAIRLLTGEVTFYFEVDFLGSRGLLESPESFPLSVIALYFLWKRNWQWFLIAALLCIIGFKRIAILGMCISVAFFFIYAIRNWQWNTTHATDSIKRTGAISILIFALVAINMNSVVDILVDYFSISESRNQVTLGRYHINEFISYHFWGSRDWGQMLFGFGPGSGDRFVSAEGLFVSNIHNDFLKLMYEYGFFGLTIFMFATFSIYKRTNVTISILLLNSTLMITDNTLIYYFHQFTTFIVCCAIFQVHRQNEAHKIGKLVRVPYAVTGKPIRV